jgi:hypothetical protein
LSVAFEAHPMIEHDHGAPEMEQTDPEFGWVITSSTLAASLIHEDTKATDLYDLSQNNQY